MIIRESSNMEDTSSDNELEDWEAGGEKTTDTMNRIINSQNQVDKKLLEVYRLRKIDEASQVGIDVSRTDAFKVDDD